MSPCKERDDHFCSGLSLFDLFCANFTYYVIFLGEAENDSRPFGANITPLNPLTKRSTSTRSSNIRSVSECNASMRINSCSTGTCNKPGLFKENPFPYNWQSQLSLCLKNPCNQGILRNAIIDCKVLSTDVCTQRINSVAR